MSDLNSIMPYVIIVLMVIVGITNLITYFSKSQKNLLTIQNDNSINRIINLCCNICTNKIK